MKGNSKLKKKKILGTKVAQLALQWLLCLSFCSNLVSYFKQALKIEWFFFSFSIGLLLAGKKDVIIVKN